VAIMQITPLDLTYRTMAAELAERVLDGDFASEFDPSGRFVLVPVKGKSYWYYERTIEGRNKRQYVGPQADPDVTRRVDVFKTIKHDVGMRRSLVSTLVRQARLPRPEAMTGEVVAALSKAGLFRLRAVLIGTVAYQCYPILLGCRFPNVAVQTADADFAQFQTISAAVEDTIPPVLDVLREVDPGFREVPHQVDGRHTTQFACGPFKVEFLTPAVGSDEEAGRPQSMPALGGASAQALRFLDFLIYQPVRSTMLHRAGIAVTVPAPERYAVHKLIVSSRRLNDVAGQAKAFKDRRQAAIVAQALVQCRRADDLAEAFTEAWERGPAWQEGLRLGWARMKQEDAAAFADALEQGGAELGLKNPFR
jgi:hypothetical protein